MKAVKKGNTTAKTAGKVRIPANERKAVTQYRGFMISEGRKHVTDEQAYQSLLKGRMDHASKLAKNQEDQKREARENAKELIDPAIMKLGEVRDLLGVIERGGDGFSSDSALAMFARAALSEAGTELEQALFDLGVLKKGKHDCRTGGWFVDKIESGADAEVQKTSLVAA